MVLIALDELLPCADGRAPKLQAHPFICIEGIDGVGKTTVARMLARRVEGMYYKTPPPPYDSIRDCIDVHADPLTRFHFYLSAVGYASRQIQETCMTSPVVCDRYIYSTIAYHAAMEERFRSMADVQSYYQPDYAILLSVNEDERIRRILSRPHNTHDGRLEENSDFLMRVDREFRAFELDVIDTSCLGIEAVVEEVLLRIR